MTPNQAFGQGLCLGAGPQPNTLARAGQNRLATPIPLIISEMRIRLQGWHGACEGKVSNGSQRADLVTKTIETISNMKAFRILLTIGAAAASLICPQVVFADTTATVVPPDPNDAGLLNELKGAPANVTALILNFDQISDKTLQQQKALLLKLKTATTTAEREALRALLKENRQDFLAELKVFRHDLRADLQALKGTINHAEVLRILAAAKQAVGPAGPAHKGK